MTTFTIITEESPNEEVVTQAEEKLFIAGLPIVYKMGAYQEPELATYNYQYNYGDRHNITLADGKETLARADEITPSRSLTDAEMILYLTEQLYEASLSADSYKKMYHNAVEDIDAISTALSEEAENRGWCSEYNDFCHQVNATLKGGGYLQPLEQEYEVEVEVEATIRVSRTVYVMAASQEDAVSMVSDDPECYLDPSEEASEAARSFGWDDIEVTVN
jgi:hypothetical protein